MAWIECLVLESVATGILLFAAVAVAWWLGYRAGRG